MLSSFIIIIIQRLIANELLVFMAKKMFSKVVYGDQYVPYSPVTFDVECAVCYSVAINVCK